MTTVRGRSALVRTCMAILLFMVARRMLAGSPPLPEPAVLIVTASLSLIVAFIVSGISLSGAFSTRVLVVGTSALAAKVIDEVAASVNGRYQIIGVVDDSADGGQTPGVSPWLGPLDHLGRIIDATRPSWIVMAL